MATALLGVDIGTTNLKAVAFSPEGKELAKASSPTPTKYPKAGWAEFDHHELWQSLVAVIREVVSQLTKDTDLAAIAFTGMAEAGVPLDKDGKPLYSSIAWFDQRVVPQMEHWQNTIGTDRTSAITGLPIASAAGILRPLWLREQEPELFAKATTWLNLPDFAAFNLCGAKVTEYSLASRMMVLDLATKNWSHELLDEIDFGADFFGELAPSGVQIGTVNQAAAELTGLPPGLPVCTAGHDHLCAAVGLGVTEEGDLFDSIGTAEAVVASLGERSQNSEIAEAGVAQGIHVLADTFYAISGNSYGGGSIDWCRQLLHGAMSDNNLAFESLISMAEHVPAGSGGAFFLPHLRQANPPISDSSSRGAFVGLSSDTEAGHLARAVFEGLAFEYQRILDTLNDQFSLSNRRLVATGGGTRNKLFMQIKSDVSGLPICIPKIDEATCLGAAIAAGIGVDIYKDFSDASAQINISQTIIEPNSAQHDFYQERYQKVYLNLYDSLKNVNHQISDWVNSNNESAHSA